MNDVDKAIKKMKSQCFWQKPITMSMYKTGCGRLLDSVGWAKRASFCPYCGRELIFSKHNR